MKHLKLVILPNHLPLPFKISTLSMVWLLLEAIGIPTSQIELAFMEDTKKTELLTKDPDQPSKEAAPEPTINVQVAVQSVTFPTIAEQEGGSNVEPRRSARMKDPNRAHQLDYIYF